MYSDDCSPNQADSNILPIAPQPDEKSHVIRKNVIEFCYSCHRLYVIRGFRCKRVELMSSPLRFGREYSNL